MIVSRAKPGPSGVKNSVRCVPRTAGDGTPLTSSVNGCKPPDTFSATCVSEARSSREPLGGNRIFGAAPAISPGSRPGRKRCNGSGSLLLAAKIAPFGARASGAGTPPMRAKASNRIGAAALRPTRPGTGAPSGRPTQTPMVRLPSKPTDHASRYP